MTAPLVFQKKPTQVEAMRWTGGNAVDLLAWGAPVTATEAVGNGPKLSLWVEARSSWCDVQVGEWIICNEHGFISASPELFGHLYERVLV